MIITCQKLSLKIQAQISIEKLWMSHVFMDNALFIPSIAKHIIHIMVCDADGWTFYCIILLQQSDNKTTYNNYDIMTLLMKKM